ncbi:MAG: hypothetical protein KAI26_06555 [Nanoarchaeota archaeon]|nr:hypothetical protein [Nanoarchaeota archaeon]
MTSNVLKYVKSAINHALPVLIFAGIASMSGYHLGYNAGYNISQKQEQKKHSFDNVDIRVEDYGNLTFFSVDGTLSGESFSISNLQRYEPNSNLVKFGSRYNQLENIIKEEIVDTDGSGCYDNLDVEASKYSSSNSNFCRTKIKITPKK